MELSERHRIVVDPGQEPERLDKFLQMRLSGVSRNKIQSAADTNCILVNDSVAKSSYKVKPGDTIVVLLPYPPHNEELVPQNLPLDIVYEDPYLVVVNKQPGMVVHPAPGNYTGTLLNGLLYHLNHQDLTHSSVSQADSSPNLGEQPGIPAPAHSSPKLGEVAQRAGGVCENPASHPLLQVKDLRVTYTLKKNILGKPLQTLDAVDHVSFDLYRGETLGLVGESGCGKSTLGQALLRLIDRSGGEVLYDGVSIDAMTSAQRKALRLKMQIIFQDPYSSLNPRITIGEAIAEPLKVHRTSITSATSATSIAGRVKELMQQVGLSPDWYGRYPHELSGGQRQRVCIRALIVEPELVVCDESVSALDVSVQAQVLILLNDLKRQHGYTYLFITHDLSVVKFLSDRIMVMRQGRLVEMAPADELYAHPQEEYTRHLIDALPRL